MKTPGLLLFIFAFVMAACQGSKTPSQINTLLRENAIVGGKTTKEIKDPAYWTVGAMELKIHTSSPGADKTENSFCTGTLIAPDLILTAAHCLIPSEKSPFATVRIEGSVFFSQTGEHYLVKKAIAHPHYNENVSKDSKGVTKANPIADIGLLLLENPVQEPLRIAEISTRNFKSLQDVPTRIYGYGSETYMNRFFSTQASDSETAEDDSKTPLRWVDAVGTTQDLQLRYDQTQGKGFCKGDSGGPHFVYEDQQPVVIAISSSVTDVSITTPDWCRRHSVAILTAPFQQWIEKTIETLRSSP